MQFDEALDYLLGLGHETLAIKLGLQNTEVLLETLGNPQRDFFSIQIAGTNGKGSTAAFLEAIARAAGIPVGLYTSPHLRSITERIKINGKEISPENFAYFATKVRDAAELLAKEGRIETFPTFFEQLTAIALLACQEQGMLLAVLETGLGGRLDATTCANAHEVVITPVDMDHEEYLGHTIKEIAAEKAAVIRPGVTAVIGLQHDPVFDVIVERCNRTGVRPIFDESRNREEDSSSDGRFCVTFETPNDRYERIWLGLRGRHQIMNASLAIIAAEALREKGYVIPKGAIISGIEMAEHLGRLQIIPGRPRVLLDGAHNPAGARALRDYLEEFTSRPLTIIFGAMRDKKIAKMAEILFPLADELILTKIDHPRAATLDELKEFAIDVLGTYPHATDSAAEAIEFARRTTAPNRLICAAGSLYLVGEMQQLLLPHSR